MSFIIQCACGQQMTAQDEQTGSQVLCVACRRRLLVPAVPSDRAQPVPASEIAVSGAPSAPGVKPNRAGIIFGLGIASLVMICLAPFVGIPAWVMANGDLRDMKAGFMDRSGESLTQAGRILAIIALVLCAVGVFFYAGMIVIMLIVGAFSGPPHRF